jgi:hypothetical protein
LAYLPATAYANKRLQTIEIGGCPAGNVNRVDYTQNTFSCVYRITINDYRFLCAFRLDFYICGSLKKPSTEMDGFYM